MLLEWFPYPYTFMYSTSLFLNKLSNYIIWLDVVYPNQDIIFCSSFIEIGRNFLLISKDISKELLRMFYKVLGKLFKYYLMVAWIDSKWLKLETGPLYMNG